AVPEGDWDLLHPETLSKGSPGRLDLEPVPGGADMLEWDSAERAGREALEAARQIAGAASQREPGVDRSPPADCPAPPGPVDHPPPAHIPRADDQVRARGLPHQPVKIARVMREVAVHLYDRADAMLLRPGEARPVRRADPILLPAVEHMHTVVSCSEP